MDDQSYAGFWKRLIAYLIDSMMISLVGLVLFLPIFVLLGMNEVLQEMEGSEPSPGVILAFVVATLFGGLTALLCQWLYFALMESSSSGGTLGKMAIGIKVVDMHGNRITFWRATGRHFAKYISACTFGIGYVMAGFTQQKQALHDIVAGCLVVNRR
jgi:uncharacterized RDD family membrane protein YckC